MYVSCVCEWVFIFSPGRENKNRLSKNKKLKKLKKKYRTENPELLFLFMILTKYKSLEKKLDARKKI